MSVVSCLVTAVGGLAPAAAGGLAFAAAMGCTTRTESGATDPQHQSISEFNLGLDAFQHGDFRVALAHALRAVQLDDQSPRANYLTSVVYFGFCNGPRGLTDPDCRLKDAEKFARQAIKLAPTDPDAKNLLGEVLINEQRYPDAIAVLLPLTTDPTYTSMHLAWGNLGWAEVQAGDVDKGVTSLKNSVAANAQFCVGYYHLGIAFERKGDLSQADANLTSALTIPIDPCKNFQDAYEERAKVRQKLGQGELARADFERCKALAPNSQSGQRCAQALATPTPITPALLGAKP